MKKKFVNLVVLGSLLSTSFTYSASPSLVDKFKELVLDKKFLFGNATGASLALGLGYLYCLYHRKDKCHKHQTTTSAKCSQSGCTADHSAGESSTAPH